MFKNNVFYLLDKMDIFPSKIFSLLTGNKISVDREMSHRTLMGKIGQLCANFFDYLRKAQVDPDSIESANQTLIRLVDTLKYHPTFNFKCDVGLIKTLSDSSRSLEAKARELHFFLGYENKIMEANSVEHVTDKYYLTYSIYYDKVKIFNPVIFLIGNLDSLTEDILNEANSCDEIKERILAKNNHDIIKSLKNLFTPEEISRIGLNNILFPSLTMKEYQKIIDLQIQKTIGLLESNNLGMEISPKLKELIYSRIIHPQLGARSVNSSYRSIFEAPIVSTILNSFAHSQVKSYQVSVNDKLDHFTINDVLVLIPSSVNTEDSIDPSIHRQIAIHEAGHAYAYYALNNKPPEYIKLKLDTDEIGGFVKFPFHKTLSTKKSLKNHIKVALAGIVTERMFFEADDVSAGCYSDLKNASATAQQMILKLGMGKTSSVYEFNDGRLMAKSLQADAEQEIQELMKECETEISKLLLDNKDKIELLVSELVKVNRMSGTEMIKVLESKVETKAS